MKWIWCPGEDDNGTVGLSAASFPGPGLQGGRRTPLRQGTPSSTLSMMGEKTANKIKRVTGSRAREEKWAGNEDWFPLEVFANF